MKCLAGFLAVLQMLLPFTFNASTKTFSDVKKGSWYYESVMEMTSSGWLFGYEDGTFRPKREISGGEFVAIAARRAGISPGTGQSSHWASGLMQAALERGWYDWDEFPPTGETFDRPITRQIAVKILMKAFLPDVRGDYTTESAKIADFSQLDGRYYEGVFAAYSVGVVLGDKEGTFRPKAGLSRAEACALILRAVAKAAGTLPENPGEQEDPPGSVETVHGGVTENGALQVKGARLCNEKGEPIVLRGMSSHGLQWYGQFASEKAMRSTAEKGANLFRLAMYTGENGYISNPEAMKKKVIQAADAAIRNDMYVIIDWHILSDGNPKTYLKEAKAFFGEMAKRYRDNPAVLYEICNEPNGNVTWEKDVKPYAQEVIQTIRAAGSQGVILVGSPTWSQDIHLAAESPLSGENLMYTCHFYAGTHGKWLRDRIDSVLKKGLPIFVSEWGTSRADGSGGVFPKETKEWLDFLDSRGISWANWSLCDKNETSAALRPGADPDGPWSQSDLSESGKLVFSRF